jgi:beta-N-acetylhexosaminidase
VEKRTIRRRRVAAAALLGGLAAAIGISAALGDGDEPPREAPSAADLSLRELAGARLVSGFHGTHAPRALRRMIRRGELAGVVLFSENISSRSSARHLVRRLQAIRRPPGLRDPLLVMVDQEGGEIRRLPGAPVASAAEMGRQGAAYSRRQGRLTAGNLRRAGINVDLAPVLDVGRRGGVISEEGRAFGSSAAKVSATGLPFAAGLRGGGVAATAKHFPGLGAAEVNTDFGVEQIDLPKDALRKVDEAPFENFAGAGGELVMMSIAVYSAFSERPAVFSRVLATNELRGRLGFEGVSASDDLGAAAARAFGSTAKRARAAAAAGTDLLLFRSNRSAALAGVALRKALGSRALPRDEFLASVQRVLDLRAGLGG